MIVEVKKKMNCWEYKKCGRELGGAKVNELGSCPAVGVSKLNGVHDGWNAGRACWVVAGTMCEGTVQGVFGNKYGNCRKCDFYETVKKEESTGFKLAAELLEKLK
jgi:hypothetical protein